ncbi:MAG TPA: flavodoxin domain-containing protein [Pseudothermotoga sp.]
MVYDSYTGTVEKCAKLLAEKLGNVDLVNISKQKLPNLQNYDCVVIGSYVHAGHVSKKIRKFTTQNLEALKNKKLGIYLCMLSEQFDRYLNSNFDKDFLNMVKVKDFFGGELNYQRMNFLYRFILKNIEKNTKPRLGVRVEKIDEFARNLLI